METIIGLLAMLIVLELTEWSGPLLSNKIGFLISGMVAGMTAFLICNFKSGNSESLTDS